MSALNPLQVRALAVLTPLRQRGILLNRKPLKHETEYMLFPLVPPPFLYPDG